MNTHARDLPAPTSLSSDTQDAIPSRSTSAAQGSVTDSTDYPTNYSTTHLVREAYTEPDMPHANGVHFERDELPRLQANGHLEHGDNLAPFVDDDPASFALVSPPPAQSETFSLEHQTQALFSKGHLQVIFADPGYLFKFTSFLGMHRPQSVPILVHYLDSLKSLRAINYANAICEGLDPVEGYEFTQKAVKLTINTGLEERARAAFDVLATEELPAYITHQYIQVVSNTINARITGSLSPGLRDASDGLAEVFCLTDPSRQDNPIVFASEGMLEGRRFDEGLY
jgi:hypothetical protein